MEQSHAPNPLSFAVDCERPEFACNFQGQTSKYKPVNPIIFAYSCSQTLMSEVSNIIEKWKGKTSVEVFHGFSCSTISHGTVNKVRTGFGKFWKREYNTLPLIRIPLIRTLGKLSMRMRNSLFRCLIIKNDTLSVRRVRSYPVRREISESG